MIGFIISVVNIFKANFFSPTIVKHFNNTITQEHNNLSRNKRDINYKLSFETVPLQTPVTLLSWRLDNVASGNSFVKSVVSIVLLMRPPSWKFFS